MNFLGHCLITQFNPEYISGNLAGDHFKGDLALNTLLPSNIKRGVEIHRFIDSFTDSAPEIQKVAKIFQEGGVKRISYIASDIILDHYISKNWSKLSPFSLPYFIDAIYQQTSKDLIYLPEKFHYIFGKMVEKNWLSRYISEDGIELTLLKFEQRIPFINNLHDSFQIYKDHQFEIDELYTRFINTITNVVTLHFKLNMTSNY
ncbi:MAG: ACP phosphodiesterase [Putridiphycobacter sp.]|nr:ACP phosphodiesterase [Putridiphycobacter sp.]